MDIFTISDYNAEAMRDPLVDVAKESPILSESINRSSVCSSCLRQYSLHLNTTGRHLARIRVSWGWDLSLCHKLSLFDFMSRSRTMPFTTPRTNNVVAFMFKECYKHVDSKVQYWGERNPRVNSWWIITNEWLPVITVKVRLQWLVICIVSTVMAFTCKLMRVILTDIAILNSTLACWQEVSPILPDL